MNAKTYNLIIEQKDEVIASLKRQLNEKDDLIATKDRTIASQNRTIASQEETWKENRKIIDQCQERWFEQDKLIDMYHRRLGELTRQLKMQKKGVSTEETGWNFLLNERIGMKLIKVYKWKVFGWHLLASRKNIRYYPASRRDSVTARTMRNLRNQRYNKHNGCCELCGEQYPKESMQMHHVLPYAIFPRLIRKKWNLMMLCPRCHFLVRHNIPMQMNMMQRMAYRHGVNLEQGYHRAAVGFWDKKQEIRETVNKQ